MKASGARSSWLASLMPPCLIGIPTSQHWKLRPSSALTGMVRTSSQPSPSSLRGICCPTTSSSISRRILSTLLAASLIREG